MNCIDAQDRPVVPGCSPKHGSSYWMPAGGPNPGPCDPALTGPTWRGNPPGYDRDFEEAQQASWDEGTNLYPEIMFEVDQKHPGTEGWRP